jgi:hypothetical protein
MKVEIFHSVDPVKLQTQLNDFLGRNSTSINVVDIKFQHVVDSSGEGYFSALILYKPVG